ncbi:hypothetical protein DFJ73DRAFT_845201 [Zopfochytrium polystomum]|nr:hypothetical protein DFJ73DRAFT_845201 [Zopfochytrium polystomum]
MVDRPWKERLRRYCVVATRYPEHLDDRRRNDNVHSSTLSYQGRPTLTIVIVISSVSHIAGSISNSFFQSIIMRSLFLLGESSFRAKELALRRFWQQDSNIPTYVRRKYDPLIFGWACLCVGGTVYSSVSQIWTFVGPKK